MTTARNLIFRFIFDGDKKRSNRAMKVKFCIEIDYKHDYTDDCKEL